VSLFLPSPARPPAQYNADDEAQYRLAIQQVLRRIPNIVDTATTVPTIAPRAGEPNVLAVTVNGLTAVYVWDGTAWGILGGPGGGVPPARQINTTIPLTGGGDLSANRTLAVNTFGAAQSGVVPLSGGGAVNFLRADGTWVAPTAVPPNADYGDITVAAGVWTIDPGVVTLAKMANMNTDRLLGRDTAAAGAVEELTVTGGLEFTGAVGIQRSALTGDVTASAGSNATTIANNAVTDAKFRQGAALSAVGVTGNAPANVADMVAASDGDVLRRSGVALGFGPIPEASVTNLVSDLSTLTSGVAGAALKTEPYLTVGNTAGLSAERSLTAGLGMQSVDGGVNSTFTLNIDWSPSYFCMGA